MRYCAVYKVVNNIVLNYEKTFFNFYSNVQISDELQRFYNKEGVVIPIQTKDYNLANDSRRRIIYNRNTVINIHYNAPTYIIIIYNLLGTKSWVV